MSKHIVTINWGRFIYLIVVSIFAFGMVGWEGILITLIAGAYLRDP